MSISEMEERLGITEEDKIDCPHMTEDGVCGLGYSCDQCEEAYEDWLVKQIAEKYKGGNMTTEMQNVASRKIVGRKCCRCGNFVAVYVHETDTEVKCETCGYVNKIVRHMTVHLADPEDVASRRIVYRKCCRCGNGVAIYVHNAGTEAKCYTCGYVNRIVRHVTVQLAEQEGE